MNKSGRIYVAGHRGLVGSAIVRRLVAEQYSNLLLATRAELDLRDQKTVDLFFAHERPEYVFLAAAKVGGIDANDRLPADFIRDNLQIQTNIIDSAYRHDVRKLIFLGSSCVYPRDAQQPLTEAALLSGPLEPTNEWYAVAKIAGIKMCQAYRKQFGFDAICLMPTNLYGPGDDFDSQDSHVLPALIRKFYEAKVGSKARVVIWGSGRPRREFLQVDDLADAVQFLARNYSEAKIINIGAGKDITIAELADMIAGIVGYKGEIVFDTSRPDGTPRKLLDVSRLEDLGWKAKISLVDGITETYQWYVTHGLKCVGGAA